ncbi:flagellar hook-basal body complex protein FliE [Pacificimonas sp. ICDLI1SI03]|jgi:flagellar hook-basal body complex protein FliE|tara:strand:+ start:37499 stop:37810 length:312 start_codon:yes stop_codon:yes gene_type:complete
MKVDHSKLIEMRAEILARSAEFGAAKKPSGSEGFGGIMSQAVDQVASMQSEAGKATDAFERGESQDIAGMMLARQKSSLAFQATLQVRNKVLSAYKDVMNMPV